MTNEFPFREFTPKRTYVGRVYKRYKTYKKHLIKDFKSKCGYTDTSDRWFGGKNNFHIDHFISKDEDPSLINKYSNLIYCCAYVNILKKHDKYINYLDPCDEDFNSHFYRDKQGTIYPSPSSAKAQYMHNKLQLGLKRYRIVWKLDKLLTSKEQLTQLMDTLPPNHPRYQTLKDRYLIFSREFDKYLNYLHAEL